MRGSLEPWQERAVAARPVKKIGLSPITRNGPPDIRAQSAHERKP
jgi:hypothetical protein